MTKKKRRAGATATFSVSVGVETKKKLKARADRLHGGNVSALIEDLAREAERRDASEALHTWAGTSLADEERTAIDAELEAGWAHARAHARKPRRKPAA